MATTLTRVSDKAGLPPGTLVYVGELAPEKTAISVIDYNEERFQERAIEAPEECKPFVTSETVTWINVTGLRQADVVQRLGDLFDIHPLVLEDILNTNQRPRIEDMGAYIFLIIRMLYRHPANGDMVAEQVSLLVGRNYVMSFQEIEGDVFDAIRTRIRTGRGRIRKLGADYLAYSLIDAIVDNYFVVLEDIGEGIEDLQDRIIDNPGPETLGRVHRIRRDLILFRKAVWPVRELVSGLERAESPLIHKATRPYLRDVYEHTVQVIDTLETSREMITGAVDICMTSISNRLNEVMRVLTVITTIFIPLSFIAGVYGMNFEHMPELHWRFGYEAVWVVMIAVAAGMLVYFRRRRWL